MGLEEVKQMDELIRKQDALDAIHCVITVTGRQNAELVAAAIGVFADRIKALPPVQPKRGKWIERGTWSEGYGMGETYGKYWACNQCGREVKGFWGECGKNFCDNCGADMRGGEE